MATRPSELEEQTLYAILDLSEGDAYTLPLLERLRQIRGRDLSPGALYTVLGRLEEKGFVESEMGEATPERGGKRKRLYRVNAEGKKALQEMDRQRQALRPTLKRLGLSWGVER